MDVHEAARIAHDVYSGFDEYAELEKAFVFSKRHDDDIVRYGGMDAPLVVSKRDGRTMPYHAAAIEGLLGEGVDEGMIKPIPTLA